MIRCTERLFPFLSDIFFGFSVFPGASRYSPFLSSIHFSVNARAMNFISLFTMVFVNQKYVTLVFSLVLFGLQSVILEESGNAFAKMETEQQMEAVPPNAPTVEIIEKCGYPVEIHHFNTEDNYILTAHRIPHGRTGRNSNPIGTNNKPPVFVLHGNLQSSADWVLNSRVDNCLGFILADEGYDVWLGNIRGNIYSNKHVHLSNKEPAYWNFSLDDMANYDIPATVEYILRKTEKPKLHYIGFSLGNMLFYLAVARHPELNKKIALHVSYGPSVFFGNFPHRLELIQFLHILETTQDLSGGLTTTPDKVYHMLTRILPTVCNPIVGFAGFCRLITFIATGFDRDQISREQMPMIVGHLLTATSLKILVQGLQLIKTGKVLYYDYGPFRNLQEYGQEEPPEYNLHKITAPVVLMRGLNDIFANKKATDELADHLNHVAEYYIVPHPNFTHIAFCYGKDANELVYKHTLELLHRFS